MQIQECNLKDIKGFFAVVSTQDIVKQDYILTHTRYVGIEAQQEDTKLFEQKMQRLTTELSNMLKNHDELKKEIKENLNKLGYKI